VLQLEAPATVKVMVFLDTERPLSEPGWCKSGNIEEWLRREFGPLPPMGGWEKRIEVTDPDPVRVVDAFGSSANISPGFDTDEYYRRMVSKRIHRHSGRKGQIP
jgi:hypothetical protein